MMPVYAGMPVCAGRVSLVGAGPGDPALLTRAALARLRRADLVLFDALVPGPIVRLARRARRFPVGKRAGRPSMRQETIHALMIRAARRGQHVVRLKGGDPFVFGRGGEEALALRAAGVPFEVIPGISSAIAGAGAVGDSGDAPGQGVRLHRRRRPRTVILRPVLDAMRPGGMTLVFLMAVAAQREIATRFWREAGRRGTPAALIFNASRADGRTWTGSIAALARGDGPRDREAAGLLVIGDVVNLRAEMLVGAAAGGRRDRGGRGDGERTMSQFAPHASDRAPFALTSNRHGSGLLDLIGNTPLLRLDGFDDAIAPGVEIYAKAEWQNPGGSVKDRAAARMIADGDAAGALGPAARSWTRHRATPASPTRCWAPRSATASGSACRPTSPPSACACSRPTAPTSF